MRLRSRIVLSTLTLLAFAGGLVLGTLVLGDDSARPLDDLETDLNEANAQITDQVRQLDSLHEALDEQLGERTFGGQLSDVPVLVIATRGIERELVQQVLDATIRADADLVGIWWLTDRVALDNDRQTSDLADALETDYVDAELLRGAMGGWLGDAIEVAAGAPETDDAWVEPPRIARLHEAGFIDYELPEDAGDDVVTLPSSGLRVVVVSGRGTAVGDNDVLPVMLSNLANFGPMPVVVSAQAPTATGNETPLRVGSVDPLVSLVRRDNTLMRQISTVDDLEWVAGRVATVLALRDAVPGAVGRHYGSGDGAQRVLPELPNPEG